MDYVQKVDSRVPGGQRYGFGTSKRRGVGDDFWRDFLSCTSVAEGLRMVEEEKPLDFIKMASKLEQTLVRRFGNVTKAKFNTDWKFPFVSFEGLTVVFIGPTGIGKTNFAFSHFERPLRVTIR